MLILIIVLGIIAVVSNVIMDELDFHYDRIFGKLIPEQWQSWWNPSLSWHNKYIEGSKILTMIFSTILVWTTDAWHFFKTVFLSCIIFIVLLFENCHLIWWQYIIEFIVLRLVWGILFEATLGIFGAIGSKLNKR